VGPRRRGCGLELRAVHVPHGHVGVRAVVQRPAGPCKAHMAWMVSGMFDRLGGVRPSGRSFHGHDLVGEECGMLTILSLLFVPCVFALVHLVLLVFACMWGWPEPYIYRYIRCTYGVFSKEITMHTVIYGADVQFGPTRHTR